MFVRQTLSLTYAGSPVPFLFSVMKNKLLLCSNPCSLCGTIHLRRDND